MEIELLVRADNVYVLFCLIELILMEGKIPGRVYCCPVLTGQGEFPFYAEFV